MGPKSSLCTGTATMLDRSILSPGSERGSEALASPLASIKQCGCVHCVALPTNSAPSPFDGTPAICQTLLNSRLSPLD